MDLVVQNRKKEFHKSKRGEFNTIIVVFFCYPKNNQNNTKEKIYVVILNHSRYSVYIIKSTSIRLNILCFVSIDVDRTKMLTNKH